MEKGEAMKILITYGSHYGSARHYAQTFAKLTKAHILPYSEVKSVSGYDCVIHFGALYAGGALGLKSIASLLSEKTDFIIVTVGLADVHDEQNTNHIRRSIQRQIPKQIWNRARIYHLRGAIDYEKLNFKHRTMMALLYAKAKNLPEEKKNAETRAMIETYGKHVSFVDDESLRKLADTISSDLQNFSQTEKLN